ncbi:MAG TPA: DUF4232 domain-containing protein, partial [Candidatus Saccharimonas sp.]|nr:DUF4232 domain-containing protein [Candidatus Saccharimonas sp.]
VATATPVETPTPTPAIGRCHTADLSATLKASDSAAGTSYQTLGLVNKSGHTCWVYGFPGISLLDASGKQLGQPAARSGAATTTVTLLAGGSAYSTLGFPNPGNFDPGTCSAQSTSLNIYPPDETAAIVVADGKQACPGFSVTALSPTAP